MRAERWEGLAADIPQGTVSYTDDDGGRPSTVTMGYDNANGLRTSMGGTLAQVDLPAALSSSTYNANNQLTQRGAATLTYDLNGNLTHDGSATYTWNARNQLAAFGAISFAYDSSGRRTLNAAGKSFLYDGVNAVQELSGSTVTANMLTGGVDQVFTRTDAAGERTFVTDGGRADFILLSALWGDDTEWVGE